MIEPIPLSPLFDLTVHRDWIDLPEAALVGLKRSWGSIEEVSFTFARCGLSAWRMQKFRDWTGTLGLFGCSNEGPTSE